MYGVPAGAEARRYGESSPATGTVLGGTVCGGPPSAAPVCAGCTRTGPVGAHLVPVPTRIIWGREGRFLPPHFGEQLHALIPGSELHWVEGAGHAIQEDAPAQLLVLLTREFGGGGS
ncbi:hypothetical protein GCM10010498_45980 [Streptomyces cavourensis]|nr:hypothetical protein GCM10010498_45980 [Streptomyces cavourensis]